MARQALPNTAQLHTIPAEPWASVCLLGSFRPPTQHVPIMKRPVRNLEDWVRGPERGAIKLVEKVAKPEKGRKRMHEG